MYSVSRYHDISCGHTVTAHEGKCRYLHGHNYRVHFTCVATSRNLLKGLEELDYVGRVVDFSVIKERLCMWLEDNWDHKFLIWSEDPRREGLLQLDPGVVVVPFNPTAENMARYLVEIIGPGVLDHLTGVRLEKVEIEETAKCSATFERSL